MVKHHSKKLSKSEPLHDESLETEAEWIRNIKDREMRKKLIANYVPKNTLKPD
jgi:nucleoside diphosphate kinase